MEVSINLLNINNLEHKTCHLENCDVISHVQSATCHLQVVYTLNYRQQTHA